MSNNQNNTSPRLIYSSPVYMNRQLNNVEQTDNSGINNMNDGELDDFTLNNYITDIQNYNSNTHTTGESLTGSNDISRSQNITSLPMSQYTNVVQNILSKHCHDVRQSSESVLQPIQTFSKNKIRDMMNYHNTQLFQFMYKQDKITSGIQDSVVDTLLKKYGKELLNIRNTKNTYLFDNNVDVSVTEELETINNEIQTCGKSNTQELLGQLRFIYQKLRKYNEELICLETNLAKKLDTLDKLNQRIVLLQSLNHNDKLPGVISSFTEYMKQCFDDSGIEDTYKELINVYKKWHILREIVALQSLVSKHVTEPTCSVCLTESISYATVPCGHTYCDACSRRQNFTCFVCRGVIRERIKLYFT